MNRLSKLVLVTTLLSIVMTWVTPQARSQPPQSAQTTRLQPVPLAHLYWHFLVHQHDLDAKATTQEAQGRDGTWLRRHLQTDLGFSDAEFAIVRASSVRLSAELKALNDQANTIKEVGLSPSSASQLMALATTREADISAEILALKQALPPQKITTLEAFMTQFFAPKTVVKQ